MNKAPQNTGKFKINAKFTRDARTAWRHIIKLARKGKNNTILLPSYIGYTEREGSGVFDPVEDTNADYCFYELNESLSPNLQDLERKLIDGVDILLVIHYFGFCRTDLQLIREMCDRNETIMVEDCAHAFYLGDNSLKIGEVGDYSFYSVHKYLPTSMGGLLRINTQVKPRLNLLESDQADTTLVEEFALTNFEKIANIRRKNYQRYEAKLANAQGISTLYDLMDHEIPQSFPIIVGNGFRERLYFYLLDRAIPTTALYYRLIDQIKSSDYPNSHMVSQSILNLPVHQDMSLENIDLVCTEIERFITN